MTYYIPNETPEQQRTRYAKERETFISKLVDLQLAIIAMRNHAKFTRGKLDLDVPAVLKVVHSQPHALDECKELTKVTVHEGLLSGLAYSRYHHPFPPNST